MRTGRKQDSGKRQVDSKDWNVFPIHRGFPSRVIGLTPYEHCRAGCRGAQRKFVDLAIDHFDPAVERWRVGFIAGDRRGRRLTENDESFRIEGGASQTLEL